MVNLPQVFSQRDPRWSNKKLGTSASTLGLEGCLITSMAMLCRYFGKDTDPERLNASLVAVGGFQDKILYKWYEGVPKVYGDILCTKIKDTPANLTKTNWDEIDAELNAGRPVVTQVDFKPTTTYPDMHFVVIVSGSQGVYQCADPWYGDIASINRYGEAKVTIQRYVFHTGPVPQNQTELDVVKQQLEELKRAHEVVKRERGEFEQQAKAAKRDADEFQRQLEGAKKAVDEWEGFFDRLWLILNPLGKAKTQQNALGEVTEMINKEDVDRETAQLYEDLQKDTKNFKERLRKIAKSNAAEDDQLLAAVDRAIKGIDPEPLPDPLPEPEVPVKPDYGKIRKALEDIVRFLLRLVGR